MKELLVCYLNNFMKILIHFVCLSAQMSAEIVKSDRKSDEGQSKAKFLFQDGETVLCYHGPLLYEAKCVKAEIKNKSPQYLIHYSGWNKSWDEWVSCPRVCKFSEENLKKQQELLKTHGTSKIITKIKANARKSISSMSVANLVAYENEKLNKSDVRKKRAKAEEDSSELSDSYTIKNEVKISLTEELKKILVNDYQNVSALNKIVSLPAQSTVESILHEYVEFKIEQEFDRDVIIEAAQGVKHYFDSILSTKLLINSTEREQCIDVSCFFGNIFNEFLIEFKIFFLVT